METPFEREVLDRLTRIESRIDGYDKLKDVVYESQREIIKMKEKDDKQQHDIDELIERNKWLARVTAGAIITGIIGLVFVFVKIGMGVN
ncbi:hemolysin XhlA family protein [Lachnoclostridium phytofermentans]|uniref:hemolysin XhlA family protein n=1 Tax=Lachnoclostridium phytofermentans TaxID=66219 RepID=UPI000A73C8C9|nr:hemolysin XhlA family protein [Lachnoclostridium phytofermentans]